MCPDALRILAGAPAPCSFARRCRRAAGGGVVRAPPRGALVDDAVAPTEPLILFLQLRVASGLQLRLRIITPVYGHPFVPHLV